MEPGRSDENKTPASLTGSVRVTQAYPAAWSRLFLRGEDVEDNLGGGASSMTVGVEELGLGSL